MKVEKNVSIKENITIYDLANVIETIVPLIIRKENGEIKYRPYYRELAYDIAIIKYLVHGIVIEKDDDADTIETLMATNKEVSNIVINFIQYNNDFQFIVKNVDDIVEQKKQEYSAPDFTDIKELLKKSITQEQTLNDLNIKLAKKQNTLLSQQIRANEYQEKMMEHMTPEEMTELNKKFLSGEFDYEKIADIAVKHYLDSDIHKDKQKELIESQQEKIHDLSKYKAMHDARNVLATPIIGK